MRSGGKVGAISQYGGTNTETVSTTTVNNDQRHQVVARYDRDVGLQLYVDGVLESVATGDSSATNFDTTDPFVIGYYNNNSSLYFDGQIDDVRIYNRALSAQEIKNLYIMTSQFATGECADADYVLNPLTVRSKDMDEDGYGDGGFAQACTQPYPGHFLPSNLISTGGDCDDLDGRKNPATLRYLDADSDGFST